MRLERTLQIGVAILAAYGTLLLAMGEDSATLALSAIIIAGASVYLTDIMGWVRLTRRIADFAGAASAFVAFYQWQTEASEAGVLALVNFVVYVQFVLQLTKKSTATYWLLVVLSLMQVAVATALNEHLIFGVLLVGYLFVGIGVLIVFYLFREAQRSLADADRAELAVESMRFSAASPPRWRAAAQSHHFFSHVPSHQADEALNRRLMRLTCTSGATALAMASVLFCTIPRYNRDGGSWDNADDPIMQRMVGFSSEVQLGELGEVSESPEEVMQVWLTDTTNGRPYELHGEPLFRGVVLTEYANKRWKRLDSTPYTRQPRRLLSDVPNIEQHFRVQPLDTDVLFSMYPPFMSESSTDLIWDDNSEQLSRGPLSSRQPLDYKLLATCIDNHRLRSIVPALIKPTERELAGMLSLPDAQDDVDPLRGTKALAEKIVSGIPADDHVARARAFTDYLLDPANFRYSLRGVDRDPSVDPVEDFLTQNRAGHCEYFASALVLMLRSVEIPARLVVGFKGGDYDGYYYQVRALHAHAWVEAYLSPEQVPAGEIDGYRITHGGWLILDPTGGSDDSAAVSSYVAYQFRQFYFWARSTWRTYVVGMDHERQQAEIYRPILRSIVALFTGFFEREFWIELFQSARNWFSPSYWGLTHGRWFSWRGGLASIVIMLAMSLVYYALRALVRVVWRISARAVAVVAERRAAVDVDFYRRFESLLLQHDLVRGASQTPREFALAVGGQLAESPQSKHAAPLPRQLVETFYRVRFGRRALDTQEAETVEMALTELAQAMALATPRQLRDAK